MKNPLINKLQGQLKGIHFMESGSFYWSPQSKTIHYDHNALDTDTGQWALLHEAGHARLKHQSYNTDAGLLILEVAAWEAGGDLAQVLGVSIDPEHIQECLNTYRDWLYARSTCPTCELNSLQIDETQYMCLNCSAKWAVSQSRFCRPYRMQSRENKTSPESPQAMFV